MTVQLILTGEVNTILLAIFIPLAAALASLLTWAWLSFRFRRGFQLDRQLRDGMRKGL